MINLSTIVVGELMKSGEASLQTGPFGTQLKASDYVEEGVPVINVRNIGSGRLRAEKLEYLDERMADKLDAHRLKRGDIVFGRKGAVDRHLLVDETTEGWIQGSDCLRLRIESTRVFPRFVSFYFDTKGHKDWMDALCSFGATMTSLNQDIVARITLPFPEYKTQKKIAAILTAYDDLIEVNQRRIAALETMAEELYREWFVRLRFPGHAKVKLVKGVPEGWKIEPLGDLVTDIIDYRGITPEKLGTQWSEEGITALSALNVKNGRLIKLHDTYKASDSLYQRWMRKELQLHDILLTSEAPLGQVYMLMDSQKYVLSQRLFALRANPERIEACYLYHYLLGPIGQGQLAARATGSTVGGIRQQLLRIIEVMVPPSGIQESYTRLILPILNQIHSLSKAMIALRQTRDLLLPRLISGKLRVEALDIQFPPGMAD